MKKKIVIGVMIICLLLIGIGGKLYMDRKDKLAQIVEWERVVAGQIKNTFENVEEIKFSESYGDNYLLAGFIGISIEITTKKGDTTNVVLNLPIHDETDAKNELIFEAKSSLNESKIQKGVTVSPVNVIFTDKSEEKI